MYVIKNGKMICPFCKEFCDYKVFDINEYDVTVVI